MKIISQFMKALCSFLTPDLAFIIGVALLINGFIINFIIALSCGGYDKQSRKWLNMSAFMIFCFEWVVASYRGDGEWAVALYSLVATPTVYFSSLFRKKKIKVSNEQLKLAKYLKGQAQMNCPEFIDGEFLANRKLEEYPISHLSVKNESSENPSSTFTGMTPSRVKEIFEQKKKEEFGLDFSHVKNVLSRLDYFSLSPNDKRVVKELEISLAQAESGAFSSALKEQINDGLGALLKIMSKHGV